MRMVLSLFKHLVFVLDVFTILYYENEESDDFVGGSTKTAQDSRVSLETLKQYSLKLAPEETKLHSS